MRTIVAATAMALILAGAAPGRAGEASGAGTAEQVAPAAPAGQVDPFWRNATIYFLMTDRFANGDPANDRAYGRQPDGDTLRSFMGGDLAGINAKLESGYFSDLGVTALWTTPVVEQVRQPFQEFGRSYAFHGYWTRDWTKVDEAYGSEADFARMVELAHSQGIRVVVDVVINHAGPPIGGDDPAWPQDWVRTGPTCDWTSFAGVATCSIVPALQDIRTESEAPVALPPHLVAKWRKEGRLKQELRELDAFFKRTGYPRAPKYYIVKWLTDWVREYGIDGFRADTAKHIDPEVWAVLKNEAELALADWKARNPAEVLDDRGFYMVGEVFNYGVGGFQNAVAGTRQYDFHDRKVDFYDHGFDALINMGFATHARLPVPDLFQYYDEQLHGPLRGVGVLNYISSHDDQAPLDPSRKASFENAVKLMLAPGAAQIYYGDELDRSLVVPGATGDATLRSFMNWDALETEKGRAIHAHWSKLAQFRKRHLAVGAGRHVEHGWSPLVFSRTLEEGGLSDKVVIGLAEQPFAAIKIHGVFSDGARLTEAYSGEDVEVTDGMVRFSSPRSIALLEAR
jgi:alpha-amylase